MVHESFRRARSEPLAPLEHRAADVVGRARGRTLTLWPPGSPTRSLPDAVSDVRHVVAAGEPDLGRPSAPYDSVVSIGGLASVTDLSGLLRRLRPHLGVHSIVHFCEPTIVGETPATSPPHDVTGALWAEWFTVFECRRFRYRSGFRTHEYCWGQARLTPEDARAASARNPSSVD